MFKLLFNLKYTSVKYGTAVVVVALQNMHTYLFQKLLFVVTFKQNVMNFFKTTSHNNVVQCCEAANM